MKYENISVNSDNYKSLSNQEKLKVIRIMLNSIFEEGKKEKHPYTVTYNGVKNNVPKEKFGIFRDLIAREKKIKQLIAVPVDYYTLKDKNIQRSPLVDVKFDSDEYKNMSIEEKMTVIQAKYNFISNLKTFKGKPFDSTKYRNELEEMLNELKKQKKDDENNIKIEIDSNEYNKLNTENKIKVVETKLFNLTVKAKKVTVNDKKIHTVSYTYKDKNLIIPCSRITIATKLIKLLKELEKKSLEEEQNKKKNKSLWKKIIAIPVIAKIINKRKEKKNKKEEKKEKNKKTLKEKITSLKLVSKITNKKKKEKNKKTLKSRFLAFPIVAKIINKRKEKKLKNKKTIKERYNDSTLGKAMKKKKNRAITAICAYALIIASFTSCFGIKFNKTNNNKANVQKPSTSQVNDNVEAEKKEDIIIKDDELTKEEDKLENPSINNNTNKENDVIDDNISNNYSLGDTVTIEENARIYTNSYDATYNTNSYNPYYDGGYERTIEAVVYELNGYVYTIFNFDPEANSKIQQLENSGAKLTAILVNRNDISYTNNYEGFYDIDSVKVRTRSK